jgi:hypothetical protein
MAKHQSQIVVVDEIDRKWPRVQAGSNHCDRERVHVAISRRSEREQKGSPASRGKRTTEGRNPVTVGTDC